MSSHLCINQIWKAVSRLGQDSRRSPILSVILFNFFVSNGHYHFNTKIQVYPWLNRTSWNGSLVKSNIALALVRRCKNDYRKSLVVISREFLVMQVKGDAFLLFCLCVSLYELCVLLCQVKQEKEGLECRIGNGEKRPFSGVTCCVDFCAHSHKDLRNMDGGATLVNTIFSFIFIFLFSRLYPVRMIWHL